MKRMRVGVLAHAVACAGILIGGFAASTAAAQNVLPYMNPKLPAKERAEDLVSRMTLQ